METQTSGRGNEPFPERSGGNGSFERRYDAQIEPGPGRRRHSREYKLKVLSEIENAGERGQTGLILRREGLYSSQITQWRKAMGKTDARYRSLRNENARLKRETVRLKAQLEQSRKLIEIQKKMAEFVQELEGKGSEESPSRS